MVTVVNHLRLVEPLGEEAFTAFEKAFPTMQEAGCRALQIVKVADDHLVLLLVFDSADAAQRVSETIGGPLMREHVSPHLASGTERSVGDVVLSFGI
jgi:hypothetical protein